MVDFRILGAGFMLLPTFLGGCGSTSGSVNNLSRRSLSEAAVFACPSGYGPILDFNQRSDGSWVFQVTSNDGKAVTRTVTTTGSVKETISERPVLPFATDTSAALRESRVAALFACAKQAVHGTVISFASGGDSVDSPRVAAVAISTTESALKIVYLAENSAGIPVVNHIESVVIKIGPEDAVRLAGKAVRGEVCSVQFHIDTLNSRHFWQVDTKLNDGPPLTVSVDATTGEICPGASPVTGMRLFFEKDTER